MFQKPAFGANTSGFGTFSAGSTTPSPFGGFKPTTGAFSAAPAFGAAGTAQPSTSGGLFGASNTSGGLFGATPSTSAAPAFGANTGFGFGATATTGGLFGQNNTSGGLFGATQNSNNAFAAKPAGFGFGSPAAAPSTSGLFGTAPAASGGLFGQSATNTMGTGGLFSNTGGAFGQQPAATGTAHVKYSPVVGTDVVVKQGTSQNINIKHHCITCMKEYENKCLEELRLEDYTAGRKGSSGGVFGGFQQQPIDNKPLFGASTFGQPATTSAPNVFGANTMGATTTGFGQTSAFSFGSNTQNNTTTTGLFGANKPAFGTTTTPGTGLFGATTTQAPAFGTNTSTFGFGSTSQPQQQTTGLFGAKPATTGFGSATGFGGFGGASGGLFGAKPAQPAAPAASTAPAFGSLGSSFGSNTSGALFSGAFNKPAAAPAPAFGFPAPGLGGSAFGQKPAAAPTFGTTPAGGGLFQQPQQNNMFKTGLDSGLGGGMFNTNPSLGGGLGLGTLGSNTSGLMHNNLTGSSAVGNVHEQILTLAARPYGDSPLFKDLLPDSSTTAEDVLKPTNPAAMQAILCAHRVTSPRAMPRLPTLHRDKKSLFDGLEESDASLEDKLSLKPSRKRLVLRPNMRANETQDSVEHVNNRSLEEQRDMNAPTSDKGNDTNADENIEPAQRSSDNFGDKDNVDSSDRHVSWLSSSKLPWDKEKPLDGEPTPKLYPNIDKEMQAQISERRASWLTTKPLRKPLVSNPDSAENSVRELGVRTDRLSNSVADKENVDSLSVSEEEVVSPRALPPHRSGVRLTRPGYYTIPSLDEMLAYLRPDGSCVVPYLTIGRRNYGNVHYDCEMDVAGLDLDELVHFLNKEVIVYPDENNKPAVGEGLNRRAIVTLDRIWPRDKTEKRPITDPDRLLKMDYEGKLRRVCDKHDTKFIEYRPLTGSWVFRVEHFSKYGLTDSDEEDDFTPEVMKRQLANQALQRNAATAQMPPVSQAVGLPSTMGLGGPNTGLGGLGGPNTGLGGLGGPTSGLGGLGGPATGLGGQSMSLGLPMGLSGLANMSGDNMGGLGGLGSTTMLDSIMPVARELVSGTKGFDMDTTEDNNEPPSMYSDSGRAYGVKSPTSELARLEHRQSHNVQLMKASLYADTDMDDDTSVSTGDQLVPRGALSLPGTAPGGPCEPDPGPRGHDTTMDAIASEEVQMKPLVVAPQTMVLRYHRKIPPFKYTIAGRLQAACIADLSIARARHTRVGFGVGNQMAFTTSYNAITDLPKSASLSELGRYMSGRSEADWSEQTVATLRFGQAPDQNVVETLRVHMETLLEYSTLDESSGECPRLCLLPSPSARRKALAKFVEAAKKAKERGETKFGVSNAYCYEIWKLCEALWGADLENDGVAGTDDLSIVNRHRKLLEWLTEHVASITDEELAKPVQCEEEDETDSHSSTIWTLLLGGRVLDACRRAREKGDLNMAALIAQAQGDPTFAYLISRQLTLWRECGASDLISRNRLRVLSLLARLADANTLRDAHWTMALHATARYLCPQVPTLEQILRKYESFFTTGSNETSEGSDPADPEVDLTELPDDVAMEFPVPPYWDDYDVKFNVSGKRRRVLDLRYELVRARAYNTRPKLQPASYTPDPLDYSLCFVLSVWLGLASDDAVSGAATQLENCGLWHLAVRALQYHPDSVTRAHLIRGVLSRHAPARTNLESQSRLESLARSRVPERWIHLARAHRAKYEHLPALEAEHLVNAEEWNAAHTVLIEELLPQVVLADNVQSISPLLQALSSAASQGYITGWTHGGLALSHYVTVCDEIRGLVSESDRAVVSHRLESLRPCVVAACRALPDLKATTVRQLAARAEMGSRLLQVWLTCPPSPPSPHTPHAPHALAAALRGMRLPPGTADAALMKITSELADQASELCIESPNSSPHSSHQRATVIS